MSVLVEVCVDSIQSLHAAIRGGADRIELCSALALGGLTPSDGFMRAAAETDTPTFAMIRPHAGGFDYSPDDIAVMEEDIRRAADLGLAGVVFGATADDALNVSAMNRLVAAAGNMGKTLHRAFDLLEDPVDAVDKAIDIGVDRILTFRRSRNCGSPGPTCWLRLSNGPETDCRSWPEAASVKTMSPGS